MHNGKARLRFPWAATLVVLAAVGLMVSLGVWQLHRLAWKEALIARYSAAQSDSAAHEWRGGDSPTPISYSHVRVNCAGATAQTAVSGENARHQSGWALMAECGLPGGGRAKVRLGWANQPQPVPWAGGVVTGTALAQAGREVVIVADPPLAGLQANARPDPRDMPNNHLSYAVQWFLFAATAVVIYGLALRKRLKG